MSLCLNYIANQKIVYFWVMAAWKTTTRRHVSKGLFTPKDQTISKKDADKHQSKISLSLDVNGP